MNRTENSNRKSANVIELGRVPRCTEGWQKANLSRGFFILLPGRNRPDSRSKTFYSHICLLVSTKQAHEPTPCSTLRHWQWTTDRDLVVPWYQRWTGTKVKIFSWWLAALPVSGPCKHVDRSLCAWDMLLVNDSSTRLWLEISLSAQTSVSHRQ
jgi:hypothetical protein